MGHQGAVNLQAGIGKGTGAHNILHKPGGHPFQSSFLNTLILIVV